VSGATGDVDRWLERWAAEPYAYLTTYGRRTGAPHRIEIWFAVHDGDMYLLSGGRDRSDWVLNIQRNANVSVELGDAIHSGNARILEPDTAEDRLARELLVTKYRQGDNLDEWGRTSLPIMIRFPSGT